jgi:uncharacterized membrane protein
MFTHTLWELALASFAFTGGHFILSAPAVRIRLAGAMGDGPFLGIYSLVMGLAFVWLLGSYARAPYVTVWQPPGWTAWVPLFLMPFALILLVGSFTPHNPTRVRANLTRGDNAKGIVAVTRHPMLWGFTLWAAAHLCANGDAAGMILFGGLLVLSLFGPFAIDDKLRRRDPEAWAEVAARTSNVPLVAMISGRARFSPAAAAVPLLVGVVAYILLLGLHPWLFGVSPLPG